MTRKSRQSPVGSTCTTYGSLKPGMLKDADRFDVWRRHQHTLLTGATSTDSWARPYVTFVISGARAVCITPERYAAKAWLMWYTPT